MPTRLAIVVTHPIQHFVPFYRALAADPEIELHVLYGAPIGIKSYFDQEMQTQITWNMDMLGGYSHEFLGDAPDGMRSSVWTPEAKHIGERLAAFGPDVVLVYGHAQINVWRALRWARRRKVPVITIGDSELVRQRSLSRRIAKRLTIPRVFHRYSAFLAVGDRNREFYLHYGARPNRIFVCPFTIDEATYRAAAADKATLGAEARAKYGIAPEAIVALFVGKLSERKRPQDLLDATAILARDGKPVTALFAGNGELFDAMKARAEAEGIDARFAGFVNVDALPALYAAADIVVHPSAADPHPLICSESACMGLPMVLSDRIGAVGPTDIARPGENTIVFPVGDTAALAKAIGGLASDPAKRAAMGRRSTAIFDELDVAASVRGVRDAIAAVRR